MTKKIRLLALDLDGTLLDPNSRVSEADGAAVRAARDRGVHIVVSTARWYSIAQRTARKLELRTPVICHNGAHVREPDNGAELLHETIPEDAAKEIVAFCDDGGFETYTTIAGVTYMRTPRADQIDPKRLPEDMRLARSHLEHVTGPVTGMVVFGDDTVSSLIERFAERYQGVLSFPVGSGAATETYVSITAAGCDKGRALRLVCERLDVAPAEVLAMGDAQPDIEMFELAAIGVAMGNAADDVKARADAVAPSNAEGGVAWAIRRYVLDGE